MFYASVNQQPYFTNFPVPYDSISGLPTLPEATNTELYSAEGSKKKRKSPIFASYPLPQAEVPNMPPVPAPYASSTSIPQINTPIANNVWTSEELEALHEITVYKIMTTRGWMVESQDKLRNRSIPDCRNKLSQILRVGISALQIIENPNSPESSIFIPPAPFPNIMTSMPIMHPNFQHMKQPEKNSPKLPIPTLSQVSEDPHLNALKIEDSMQCDPPIVTNLSERQLKDTIDDSYKSTSSEPKKRKLDNNWTKKETKALILEMLEGKLTKIKSRPSVMEYNWKKLSELLPNRNQKQIRSKLSALTRLEIFSVKDFKTYRASLSRKKKSSKDSLELPLPSTSFLLNQWPRTQKPALSSTISDNKNGYTPLALFDDDFFNQLTPLNEGDFQSTSEIKV